MKSWLKKQKTANIFYYLSFFLVLMPPFAVPFVSSSHYLGITVIFFLFLYMLFKIFVKKEKINVSKTLIALFLLYIASQSLSIITAIDLKAYLTTYEKILVTGTLFILSLYFIRGEKEIKILAIILFIVTALSLIIEAIIFLYPSAVLSTGKYLLNSTYEQLVALNINRGRVYTGGYDEVLIPLALYYLMLGKNKRIMGLFAVVIPVFSFISNFRTRIIMTVFAYLSFLFIFINRIKKYWFILVAIPVVFYFLYTILYFQTGYTVIDRLLLSRSIDYSTITSRIKNWGYSFDMGISSPLFGVGLGNYYDYLPPQEQKIFTYSSQQQSEYSLAAPYPHDIFFNTFAETGTVGLLALIFLLIYFLKKDLQIIKTKENGLSKAYVISFWTLFIYGTVNPTDQLAYQTLFWVLRVMIERGY